MDKKISALYLHVPFCKHLCNYCDFYKRKLESRDDFNGFEKHLLDSFNNLKNFLKENNLEVSKLETLYLGGGTPSLWGERGVKFLKEIILSEWPLQAEHEFTLEVDPDSYHFDELKLFKEIGVNRFSVGMQSFDNRYLKYLDRQHLVSDVKNLFKDLNKLETEFSVDFLIGAPHSEEGRDIISEIKQVLRYNPNHLSLYILTTRANYPLREFLPSEEWIAKEYLDVSNFLTSVGFSHYEISNFAKFKKYSKHNLKYWNHDSVLSLGVNATGLIHFEEKTLRYQWKGSSPTWTQEWLKPEELKLEKLFLALRTMWGIRLEDHFKDLERAHLYFLAKKEKGLCDFSEDHVFLTPKGFLLQDSIMNDLFSIK